MATQGHTEDECECYERPGTCYYDCRSAPCYITAFIIGTAVIAGMVAIVIRESHCNHAH